MEIEQKVEGETTQIAEEHVEEEKTEAPEGEKKEELTPEQEEARLLGRINRLRKKQGKDHVTLAEKKAEETKKEQKTTQSELNAGEKALALQSGLKKEDLQHLQETMQRTGYPMEKLLDLKWFRAEIAELESGRVTAEATPTSTKRSAGTTTDKVEYWLAKDELPPANGTKARTLLRRQFIDAKMKLAKGQSL